MGTGAQALGQSASAFPRHWQRAGYEVEQPEHEPAPMWNADTTGRGLTPQRRPPRTI